MSHYLEDLVTAQKRGAARGLTSICSAHPWVLRAAMQHTAPDQPLLIESTCNQVNQFGGYTGLWPADFVRTMHDYALRYHFPSDRLILGGDHLGPSVWQHEPADFAMQKACDLIRAYVDAGYVKIHLDASMKLADDPSGPLAIEVAAQRAAQLAQAAEEAQANRSVGVAPYYVIGTEVPIPGGAQEFETHVQVTRIERARETIEITREAFRQVGLDAAWERVIALVVQPGVEFGDDFVLDFQPDAARDLSRFIEGEPDLIYEAHSTDYQTRAALRHMVADHFAILKVGPALTFAFREAVFALALMENELFSADEQSQLVETLEAAMLRSPEHWRMHYTGDEAAQRFARRYSYSDRSRYYWPDAQVQAALQKLLTNLNGRSLPLSLLSQYAPLQYARLRHGTLINTPEALILDRITDVLRDYTYAVLPLS
jgi:D-tagatose-1,6-bisphosphate aldolase subunit GatZ/KbaZ